MFNVCEFQKKRDLPLNEECAKVFYGRIAHLKDIDFVEINISILEIIGFKNTFSEKKHKNGSTKIHENGSCIKKH